jgi:leucyl aminopeptidase
MEFFTTTSAASRRAGGCVVVGVYEKGKPGLGAAEIDTASKGLIKRHIKDGDISGRIGTSLLLPAVPGVRSARVLVVGLGKSAEFGVTQFRRANETAIRLIKGSKVRDIVNYLTLEDVDGASPYYLARYAVETTGNCFYTFNEMKSGRKRRTPLIRKMGIAVKKRGDAAKTLLGAQHAQVIVEGMSLARDLGNLPANVCTPSYLARAATKIARQQRSITTKVLGRLGMHSFLSVTGGTTEPAKLIVMKYRGAAKSKPVVLVGKGITFDAGGISLKPVPSMDVSLSRPVKTCQAGQQRARAILSPACPERRSRS